LYCALAPFASKAKELVASQTLPQTGRSKLKEPTNLLRHVFRPRVFYNAMGLGDPVHLVEDGDTFRRQTGR
jgi:hypothetical protein